MNYFVSFKYDKGYGNAVIPTTGEIEDIGDINKLQEYVEDKKHISGVIIQYFQLLSGGK